MGGSEVRERSVPELLEGGCGELGMVCRSEVATTALADRLKPNGVSRSISPTTSARTPGRTER